jgi:hypothetical protein
VYYYRIRAFNAADESAPSNVIRVTVGGASPGRNGSVESDLAFALPALDDPAWFLGKPTASEPSNVPTAIPVTSMAENSATEATAYIDAGAHGGSSAHRLSDVAGSRLAPAYANAHRHAVDLLFELDAFEVL